MPHALGPAYQLHGEPGRCIVISQRELASLRAEWSLGQDVIEKDYVLGWLLSGIAVNSELARTWVFKVEIDYRAAEGRQGPRIVEPYSLRRTADGSLVLFVVNDHGQLRSYRVDKIAAIRPTTTTFSPRFKVEF